MAGWIGVLPPGFVNVTQSSLEVCTADPAAMACGEGLTCDMTRVRWKVADARAKSFT